MRNYDEIPPKEHFMVAVLLQSLMWWTKVANVVSYFLNIKDCKKIATTF